MIMKKTLLIAALAAVTLTSSAKDTYVPEIWGNIIHMDSWDAMSDYSKPYGVYSFPASAENFAFTQLSPKSMNFYPTGNGIITSDGQYHFAIYDFDDWSYSYYTQLYTYDTKTWEMVGRPKDVADTFRAFDLAQDPTDGKVYGFFIDDTSYRFGTVDYATNKQQFIALSDTAFFGLACSNEGQLYAVSQGGNLFKIAKDGRQTLVGSLGLTEQGLTVEDRVQSATIDPRTNKMYWAAYLWDKNAIDFKTDLYEIDTETGRATHIVDFPETAQVVALHIAEPAADDAAPAAAENVAAHFEGGSLSGKVSFTAPTLTYGGETLEGQLDYTITTGGTTLASGTCQPGEQIEAGVTVDTNGEKEFTVRTSNAAGMSPKADTKTWVGYDNTVAPLSPRFSYADGIASVTWQAPDTTVHGGYIDRENLTYNIVRYPDNEVVATGIGALSFSEPLTAESFVKYSYGIVALNGGMASDTARTAEIAVGSAYTVPYSEDFGRATAFDEFTALDANGDKRYEEMWGYVTENSGYWGVTSQGSAIYRASENAADDWLITPGIILEAGKSYTLTFDSYRDVERYNELLAVGLGKGLDTDAYTILLDSVTPPYSDFGTDSVTFTVSETGTYNIGFHAISPKNLGYIYLDNIRLVEAEKPVDAISSIAADGTRRYDVYTLAGVRVRRQASSLDGLARGVYIVNGRKVVVR